MTDTAAETHVNGTAPPAPEEPCVDCAPTSGEKLLAGVAFVLGLFVIAVALDMFTGGKLSGLVPVRGAGGE